MIIIWSTLNHERKGWYEASSTTKNEFLLLLSFISFSVFQQINNILILEYPLWPYCSLVTNRMITAITQNGRRVYSWHLFNLTRSLLAFPHQFSRKQLLSVNIYVTGLPSWTINNRKKPQGLTLYLLGLRSIWLAMQLSESSEMYASRMFFAYFSLLQYTRQKTK